MTASAGIIAGCMGGLGRKKASHSIHGDSGLCAFARDHPQPNGTAGATLAGQDTTEAGAQILRASFCLG